MNCTKKNTITGYRVRYADLRERIPRTIHEVINPVDSEALAALNLLGLNAADFITSRYERGGYHVVSVERITPKRAISVDLRQLWENAGKDLQESPATISDLEVHP